MAGTLDILLRRVEGRNCASLVSTLCAQSVEYRAGRAIDDHGIKKPAGARPADSANDGAGSEADRSEIPEQRWKITYCKTQDSVIQSRRGLNLRDNGSDPASTQEAGTCRGNENRLDELAARWMQQNTRSGCAAIVKRKGFAGFRLIAEG